MVPTTVHDNSRYVADTTCNRLVIFVFAPPHPYHLGVRVLCRPNRRLVAYLCFFLLFFCILILESDVTFQHGVETGITDFINQVLHGAHAAIGVFSVVGSKVVVVS